jgi:hypothetical protein
MKKVLLFLLLGCALLTQAQQKLLSPKEFLGYELGDRFTRHHRVIEYYQHVAAALPHIQLKQYGETYEHRPLVYAVVTTPENARNLEQIRMDNLRRAGVIPGTPTTQVAIVWLSYNVHGNEANSMEASMKTLHQLADPSNSQSQAWLKNTVVILDPCINPDGRDRYANFYNQYGNAIPNPSLDSKEHREPWPGGRANHYMFDLNRDWAWQTQIESQQRIVEYNQWLPHVHVDFHEQGHNEPYYFAPAAEPYHEVITPWQREFQVMIGKNHAKYFDAQGWLYFTKEFFDLYYPSYGDTYPTYNGSIGMTYEQGGGPVGGLTVTTAEGDPLTLKDRLTHHHTTGISTVEISATNSKRLLDEFEKYFRDNRNNPSAPYKSYVVKGNNNADKVDRLLKLLDTHGIQYGYAAAGKATRGFDYSTQLVQNVSVATQDIVISTYQPKSRLITTLFEPQSKLPDSATYDITAWNLMYAYGLKGFALTEKLTTGKAYEKPSVVSSTADKPYAYIFRYQSLADAEFLAMLHQNNIKVRLAYKAFTVGNQSFDAGTLIVTRRNNESIADFDGTVKTLANVAARTIYTSTTGFVDTGKDFGSAYVGYMKAPRVALLFGEQTSSLSAGEVWHFFEQQLHYPVTTIATDYFKSVKLASYDVLVVPEGYYRLFDEATLTDLQTWVSNGGRLIILGGALNSFADQKGFGLKRYATDEAKQAAEKAQRDLEKKEPLLTFDDAERRYISNIISGAIYKVSLDKSHPLAFGLGDNYYTLKTGEQRFDFLTEGWNVGTLKGNVKPVQGFAGFKANQQLVNSLVMGVEDKGQGQVIYFVDNPLFRCFWENGKLAFANAVFLVGAR